MSSTRGTFAPYACMMVADRPGRRRAVSTRYNLYIVDHRIAEMTVRRALRPAALAVLLLGLAPLHNAQAKILAQWVQMGPDGTSSVRAITEDACPLVTFDGRSVPMSVRAEPGS